MRSSTVDPRRQYRGRRGGGRGREGQRAGGCVSDRIKHSDRWPSDERWDDKKTTGKRVAQRPLAQSLELFLGLAAPGPWRRGWSEGGGISGLPLSMP